MTVSWLGQEEKDRELEADLQVPSMQDFRKHIETVYPGHTFLYGGRIVYWPKEGILVRLAEIRLANQIRRTILAIAEDENGVYTARQTESWDEFLLIQSLDLVPPSILLALTRSKRTS